MYSGTHDNQTVMGWYAQLSDESKAHLSRYLNPYEGTIAEQMVQLTLQHRSDLAILPMQDVLSLDDRARMNTPGTIGSPNWEWKMINFDGFEVIKHKLKGWIKASNR